MDSVADSACVHWRTGLLIYCYQGDSARLCFSLFSTQVLICSVITHHMGQGAPLISNGGHFFVHSSRRVMVAAVNATICPRAYSE